MKNKIKLITFILLFCLTSISLNGCTEENIDDEEEIEYAGIFSWKREFVEEVSAEELERLSESRIIQIYQSFSDSIEQEHINLFFENTSKHDIDVYYLSGSPRWGIEDDAESCINEVERAYELNREIKSGEIKGIVLDVEPYLTEEWDEDKEEVMELFTENMRKTYAAAEEAGFELILCIPYYYDTEGFEKELEELIGECCDKIAVMNYYRENESKHIETELALAEKYEKQLINIYELKKPGEHGLTDKNTYYNYGMEAVNESFQNIKAYFNESDIAMALHDIEAFCEVEFNE